MNTPSPQPQLVRIDFAHPVKMLLLAVAAIVGILVALLVALIIYVQIFPNPQPARINWNQIDLSAAQFHQFHVAAPQLGFTDGLRNSTTKRIYQAATNAVSVKLAHPETFRFAPIKEARFGQAGLAWMMEGEVSIPDADGKREDWAFTFQASDQGKLWLVWSLLLPEAATRHRMPPIR